MDIFKFQKYKEICYWSKKLNQRYLVAARSGNISLRLDTKRILITATGSYLGELNNHDLVEVDVEGKKLEGVVNLRVKKNYI